MHSARGQEPQHAYRQSSGRCQTGSLWRPTTCSELFLSQGLGQGLPEMAGRRLHLPYFHTLEKGLEATRDVLEY